MEIKYFLEKYDTKEDLMILSYLTDIKKEKLQLLRKYNIEEDIIEKFIYIKKLREKNYPLQYIFKKWEFYGLELEVKENVLIPRFETELLVDEVLKFVKDNEKILDIGYGSGAISLALAKNSNSFVYGVDISKHAYELANLNKKNLDIKNVDFLIGDVFSPFEDKDIVFDIIVSNPPYINKEDMESLQKEVLYEPTLALYGGVDGLDIYKKIIKDVGKYLKEDGLLFFEIGYNQFEDIKDMLSKNGFSEIKCIKDFSGFDRIICAKNKER